MLHPSALLHPSAQAAGALAHPPPPLVVPPPSAAQAVQPAVLAPLGLLVPRALELRARRALGLPPRLLLPLVLCGCCVAALSLFVCVCVCVCVCVRANVHTHTHTHTHTHMYIYIHTCIYMVLWCQLRNQVRNWRDGVAVARLMVFVCLRVCCCT